jgi:hypothetical protein
MPFKKIIGFCDNRTNNKYPLLEKCRVFYCLDIGAGGRRGADNGTIVRITQISFVGKVQSFFIVWTLERVVGGGLISLWLYKENNELRDWKNVFTLHISTVQLHAVEL